MSSIRISHLVMNLIDYTPFSPITNATMLATRCIFNCIPKDITAHQQVFTYIDQRTPMERIILLVPIFGNLCIAIYDLARYLYRLNLNSTTNLDKKISGQVETNNNAESTLSYPQSNNCEESLSDQSNPIPLNQKLEIENVKKNSENHLSEQSDQEEAIYTNDEILCKTKLEKPLLIDQNLSSGSIQFLEHIPDEVVTLFGGKMNLINIPEIYDWDGKNYLNRMPHKIMRTTTDQGSALFFAVIRSTSENKRFPSAEISISSLFFSNKQLQLTHQPTEILLTFNCDHPQIFPFVLERLKRLLLGQSLGKLEKRDLNSIHECPSDAYLSEENYKVFSDLGVGVYEKKTEAGSTDVALYEPSESMLTNHQKITEVFPSSSLSSVFHGKKIYFKKDGNVEWVNLSLSQSNKTDFVG